MRDIAYILRVSGKTLKKNWHMEILVILLILLSELIVFVCIGGGAAMNHERRMLRMKCDDSASVIINGSRHTWRDELSSLRTTMNGHEYAVIMAARFDRLVDGGTFPVALIDGDLTIFLHFDITAGQGLSALTSGTCLIESELADADGYSIGDEINIAGLPLTIVGILKCPRLAGRVILNADSEIYVQNMDKITVYFMPADATYFFQYGEIMTAEDSYREAANDAFMENCIILGLIIILSAYAIANILFVLDLLLALQQRNLFIRQCVGATTNQLRMQIFLELAALFAIADVIIITFSGFVIKAAANVINCIVTPGVIAIFLIQSLLCAILLSVLQYRRLVVDGQEVR